MTSRTATEVTDRALRWLRSQSSKQKYFLWLHYFDPHDPYEAPFEHRLFSKAEERRRSGDRRTPMKKGKREGEVWFRAGHVFTEKQRQHFINLYDAETHYMDEQVGRFLEVLKSERDFSKTIVVLTSDHGEQLGEENHTWDHCGSLHQRELAVPLLFNVGGLPLGNSPVRHDAASTLDVLPTLLELTGVSTRSAHFDGLSLLHLPAQRRVHTVWHNTAVIQDQRWKLYQSRDGQVRLYDLSTDPWESNNRADAEKSVVVDMLEDLHARNVGIRLVQERIDDVLEELRALGYTE